MEFCQMAVARMSSSDNITALAEELGIDRDLLYRWRGQLEATPVVETPGEATPEDPRDAKLREENWSDPQIETTEIAALCNRGE
jgi:transposase-like protein